LRGEKLNPECIGPLLNVIDGDGLWIGFQHFIPVDLERIQPLARVPE
jgi:hypothetical protein